VCASCDGVEKAAPSGNRWRKIKYGTFFEKPAPKINLVEAHLNRPSPQEKGQQLTKEQGKLKSYRGFLPKKREWWSPPPTTVGRGQEKVYLMYQTPPPLRGRALNIPVDTLGRKDIFP
jgi:hypothetical protein